MIMELQSNSVKLDGAGRVNRKDRDALIAALRDGDGRPSTSTKMLTTIREICVDATRRGYGPERALIEFKLALADAAFEVRMPPEPERSKLLAALVSTFIATFYEPATKASPKRRAFDCGDASSRSH
jgi:hypothetical protein